MRRWAVVAACLLSSLQAAALDADRTTTPPVLGFPIAGESPYTAPIATVVDHAAETFGAGDGAGLVVAYTGERAAGRRGAKPPYGFFHADAGPQRPIRFVINGNYVGTRPDGSNVLNYGGHAGYDYRYPAGTPVHAAADGVLYIPAGDPIYGRDRDPWCVAHVFYIDHGDGWSSWYLHADHLTVGAERPHGCSAGLHSHVLHDQRIATVERGEIVAVVGGFGRGRKDGVGSHLHFEVRKDCVPPIADGPGIHGCRVVDPYGWEWSDADPWSAGGNPLAASGIAPLWDLGALGTALPAIDSLQISPAGTGFTLRISGSGFLPGALATFWDRARHCYLGSLEPDSLTDRLMVISLPARWAQHSAQILLKVQNRGGPRSQARPLP